MYETVKVVNGYKIQRKKGTQRFYYVFLNKDGSKYITFNSVRKATTFCESIKKK